jgi:predicted metal-binding protein
MIPTQPDGLDVTVFICVSCKAEDVSAERPGRLLLDTVMARLAAGTDQVVVRPVECLSVCKRPCTVAMAGAGKWTYVVGDLDPQSHADDVITAALSYRASDNGIIPWRQRPQSFRKGIVSRIPPLGFSLKEQGS